MKSFFIFFFCFFQFSFLSAQDSLNVISDSSIIAQQDSIREIIIDTDAVKKYASFGTWNSSFTENKNATRFDIEQERTNENNALIFYFLIGILVVLTVLRLAFTKDFEELIQSFMNANISSQLFRTQKGDISISSFLLQFIFIFTISIFVRYVLLFFYPHSALQNNFSILLLIFLFTFFVALKIILLKVIGYIFEVDQFTSEYIYNFTTITKVLGISMIPILFMFYTSSEKYFNIIFGIALAMVCICVVMLIARGLSTTYKLMYRSVYHFLIYICVAEILTVFLFIKLLTKTAI